MQHPSRKAIEAIESAKASLDLAMTELENIPEIDPATVAYAAHTLKNYLAVSAAATDLLKVYLSGHPDDQVRIWIEGLHHALQLMNHTVNRLVHSVKGIEPEFKFEKVDMGLLVFRAGNFYRRRAEWKNLDIHHDVQPEQNYAWTDRVAVAAVFDNLLSNALKFSESGKRIWIKVQTEQAHVVCTVKDEGPGFSHEDQAKLFQRGIRLSNSPTGGEQSTGYGLAIAKELVEKLGGDIWCESQPGQGAVFSLRLPAFKDQ